MPAKHSARPAGPARLILSAAAAILVLLVVWIAARAVGPASASRQPTVVVPAPSSSPSPSPPPPVVVTSASPSPSPRRSSPSPRRKSPSARASSAAPSFSARLTVGAAWEQGYVASVRVQNTGKTPRAWTVRVTHSGQRNVTLRGTWNATGRQSGDTLTFTGGTLAPGATAMFGYQVNGRARPSSCTVVGGKCSVG